VIENIFAAHQTRRAARYHYAFVETGAGFGNRSGAQIHVDVVRDKQIEAAIARAAGVDGFLAEAKPEDKMALIKA
jgi:hypothetical protein